MNGIMLKGHKHSFIKLSFNVGPIQGGLPSTGPLPGFQIFRNELDDSFAPRCAIDVEQLTWFLRDIFHESGHNSHATRSAVVPARFGRPIFGGNQIWTAEISMDIYPHFHM
jgi:hypothetical protein